MAWERLITVACCSIWTLYNWAVINEKSVKAWELRRQLIDTNCFNSPLPKPDARILKAHSHSMSGGSIWASLECQCCFVVPYYVTTHPPAIQKQH
jgi:hypothetical protein